MLNHNMADTDDFKEHRHSFVRKNAVFAVYSIYQDHESLIPDAPELLDTFLAAVSSSICFVDQADVMQESDSTCKRNAFVSLCGISQSTAVRYLLSNYDQIAGMDELMQMAVIELVRKEAKTEGGHRVSLACLNATVLMRHRQSGSDASSSCSALLPMLLNTKLPPVLPL